MSSYDLAEVWVKFLEKFHESTSENVYNAWIKPLIPLEITDTYLKVGAKNNFTKKWLEETYTTIIEGMLASITGTNLQFRIENLDLKNDGPETEAPTSGSISAVPEGQVIYNEAATASSMLPPIKNSFTQQDLFDDDIQSNLNPKYVFETFVIGNSNRFAYAAAQAVAVNPAKAYNPLFIYGGVGLGKTHLMHAIGNHIKMNDPKTKILYISSEKFTNEIINSIQNKNTDAFRKKYRNIDCLIIDDIQFLKNKEMTQEEFFHTFNTLYEANKQIIISSDRLPREIETLEDRLRSRFESGLLADIQPPDLETRIAILRKKAESENISIPHDVISLVASSIDTNIREIEGAYTKIVAYASLMGSPITVELAKKILDDMGTSTKNKQITFDDIIQATAEYFKLKKEEFFSKKRTQNIAYPRQIAMYLCRELADLSYPRIGELFGGRDHTTVIHAYEKIVKKIKEDPNCEKAVAYLVDKLKQ
ncbi:chromosomal replication initiator protein DnaA [Phascolarctobacterium sp.]|uniref:chromosomal replication initiator protein DnaA n=1 Tax=Phascolarctobacterium sp. TaxID=2049039 RepID=UPI0015AF958E|nr:chromosomal replication initiator protein DnaA [uncultured Phascolarctobacterium sp.]